MNKNKGMANLSQEEKTDIMSNIKLKGKPNKLGYKGVNKLGNRYRAFIDIRIKNENVRKYLGSYITPIEAHNARTQYVLSLV